ncbi:hypothetical protein Plec18167_009165 [Paecilomyces lecythidis]|uniref:Uncharacterized protein n=1 Tax=Paecilomyces lecythidis TaxID=3004212 RepID=A0ABR3WR93_9EURO
MQIKSLVICLLTASGIAAKDSAEDYLSSVGVTGVSDGKTATKLASALSSAYSSIGTRSDYESAMSVLETAVPTITKSGYLQHIYTTDPPKWFTGLPKDVKSEILSGQSVIEHVITSVLKIKTSKGNAAAQPTAQVMAGGAVMAGALGVVALL